MKKILAALLVMILVVSCAHKTRVVPAIGVDGNATLVQVEEMSTAEKMVAFGIFLLDIGTSVAMVVIAAE